VNTIAFPKHRTESGSAPAALPPVGVIRDIDAALRLLENGPPACTTNEPVIRQARFALGLVEKLLQTLPPVHEVGAFLSILDRCQTPWPDSPPSPLPSSSDPVARPSLSPARRAERLLSDVLEQLTETEWDHIPHFTLSRVLHGASLSATLPNQCEVCIALRQTCQEMDPPGTPDGEWKLEGMAFDTTRERDLARFSDGFGSEWSADIQPSIHARLRELITACHCTVHRLPFAKRT